MGNHKIAAEEFTIELRNNPNNPMTMVALAREQIDMGAAKEAQELLNKAMAIAPKSADVRFQAGRASYALKQYHGAIALLNSALNFDKGNPAIYKELGRTYQAMGDPTGARQNFKKYLEMEPDAADKAEFQQFL
jgi:predicted Zn-dependent protease